MMTNEERIERHRGRRAAVRALKYCGLSMPPHPNVYVLQATIERTGFMRHAWEEPHAFIERFARENTVPEKSSGSGQVAAYRVPPKFKPLKVAPHLRQRDIDAQPRQVSMGGRDDGRVNWKWRELR